jgi:predicted NAD-dependent protein-ADP-ribosyltransferase YbiA (DUF1768 family)
MSSAVVFVIARYFASVLDREIVGCFFAYHEMRFPSRNVQYPVVEHLVVGHPAQSVSEKAQRSSVVLAVKYKPMLSVPLTYLKIL